MCLAVPGSIESINTTDALLRMGRVKFGGIYKDVSLAYVPEAVVGDFVIVHVGFAISRIDPDEAERTFEVLRELGELQELEDCEPVL